MGNKQVIGTGEIQAISAGTGITHSEHNNSGHESVNFLQIWVMPKTLNISPRYEQRKIDGKKNNNFKLIVAPMGTLDCVGINQDSFFSMAKMDVDRTISYEKYNPNNGVYFFIIDGKVSIGQQQLSKRDGIGITGENHIPINSHEPSEVLCMEVPMK